MEMIVLLSYHIDGQDLKCVGYFAKNGTFKRDLKVTGDDLRGHYSNTETDNAATTILVQYKDFK